MSENLPLGSVDAILAIDDREIHSVDVPEWKCSVKVQPLTKAQEHAIRKRATRGNKVDEQLVEGLYFVHGVVEPKFTPDQVNRIMEKNSSAVNKVLLKIMDISGISEEAAEEADEDMKSE